MRSFARRSLQASAAAAGIAALGLGIAGPAFAAPSLPDVPELPGTDAASVTDLPGSDSLSTITAAVGTAAGTVSNLPGAFAFEMPQSLTNPSSVVSAATRAATLPEGIVSTGGTVGGINPTSIASTDNLRSLPAGDMLARLAAMTSGNNIGTTAADN